MHVYPILHFKLEPGAHVPTKAYPTDAGWDLYAFEDTGLVSQAATTIRTGLYLAIPEGWEAQVRPRSSGPIKGNRLVEFGTIDAGYRGEILVVARSVFGFAKVEKGDRIAQLVLSPVWSLEWSQVEELPEGERGGRGHGSSGR